MSEGILENWATLGGGWWHLFDAFLPLVFIACVKFDKTSAKFGGLVLAAEVYVFPIGGWGSTSLLLNVFMRCCSSFVSICGVWLFAMVLTIPSNCSFSLGMFSLIWEL